MTPTISVVVPTRNRARLLEPLVDAVLADPAVVEMVVVVDGEDDAASMTTLHELAARRPKLVPVRVSRRGQLAALDAAVARASTDVVLLLDDDVVPGPLLATGHARHHARRPDLVVVGAMPVMVGEDGQLPPGTALYAREYLGRCRSWEAGTTGVLDYLWGGNVSLRRADAQRVGLYSSAFPFSYHADQELGFRLADAGLEGIFDPALAAVHVHRRANASFLADARRQGAAWTALARAYPDRAGAVHGRRSRHLGLALGAAVSVAGASPAAGPIARAVLGSGTALARLGWSDAELSSARLARRIMQRRGARVGEPSPTRHRRAGREALASRG